MMLLVKTQLFSQLALSDTAWLQSFPRALSNLLHSFDPPLLILLCSALLWWAGRRLARTQSSFAMATTEFQFGLSSILIILFIAFMLSIKFVHAIPIILAFSSFALLSVSLAHSQEGKGWLTGLYQGHWTGLLLVSISFILILGLLVGSVITPDLLQLIVDALKWVGNQIMRAIYFLVSLLPQIEAEPLPEQQPMPPTSSGSEGFNFSELFSETVRSGIRLAWTIMMVGFLLVFLWRVSSQIFSWLRRRLATGGAEIEPIPGAFRADILGFLKRILLKLLGIKLPARRQRQTEPAEIASIRHLYRRLLQWTAARGHPRLAFQTPDEYLYLLEELLPATREELQLITRRYAGARYGLSSPSDEELNQLKHGWQKIKEQRLRRSEGEGDKPK